MTVNPILKEIQEKCYENLMDVCRGLAASLEINTSAVMTIQVSWIEYYNFQNKLWNDAQKFVLKYQFKIKIPNIL